MKYLFLLLGLISGVQASEWSNLTGLKGSHYHHIYSKLLDHDYHVYIKVPPLSAGDENKKLPTVYLLDGGNTFPMFVPYAKSMMRLEELPPVILVGISYGTDDWRQGNNRSKDFTLPARDRDHYGGAEAFHRFLKEELMPLVEQSYPADPEKRILFGHSLGGQLALYSAMFQPETFYGLIASNPAIHRNTDSFMQPLKPTEHQPKLFILQAEQDNESYQVPRKKWLDYWANKPHHWQQQVKTSAGHNHMSSMPVAFRQGMKWLLQKAN